jgi:hypothetical protein
MNKYFKLTITAGLALAIGTTASLAESRWTRIGNGPSFDVAQAQCNLMAMGAERGTFAYGDTNFVAGAMIGSAIGNAIRQAYVKEQCMTIQGWKYMKVASSADNPRSLPKGGKVKAGGGKAEICIRNPSACE